MIDAIRAARADIGRRHAEVLNKWRVVGAAAEIANLNLFVLLGAMIRCTLARVIASGTPARSASGFALLPLVVDVTAFRARNFLRDFANKVFERRHGGCVKV